MNEKTEALNGLLISPKLNFSIPKEEKKINMVTVKKLLCVLFFCPSVDDHWLLEILLGEVGGRAAIYLIKVVQGLFPYHAVMGI